MSGRNLEVAFWEKLYTLNVPVPFLSHSQDPKVSPIEEGKSEEKKER